MDLRRNFSDVDVIK